MAEDEEEYHPLVVLFWGAMLLLVGCGLLLYWNNLAQIDVRDRCAPRESGRCFTDESGIVAAVDGIIATIRHDDGRRTVDLELQWDASEVWPKPGTRIRLEHWNGSDVSIVDASTGRRYRTSEWPVWWDPFSIGMFGFAGLYLTSVAVWLVGLTLMRAVRSNGKLGRRA